MSGSSSISSTRSSSESSSAANVVQPDTSAITISDSSDVSSDDESSSSVEIIMDEPQCTSMKTKTSRPSVEPSTIKAIMPPNTWDDDRRFHMSLLTTEGGTDHDRAHNAHMEEMRTTPLFSANVLAGVINSPASAARGSIFPQYGLLAQRLCTYGDSGPDTHSDTSMERQPDAEPMDDRLFINVNTPWSAFICGSQGSGKSHTLSCMLENALIPSRLGNLPRPLAGIVFHYDKFSGFASNQICEAAYLCSAGIRVRVMVSLSNYPRMKELYGNLPGINKKPHLEVVPLLLNESQLNVERMMKLMAVNEKEGSKPLYMEVVNKHLRQIALERKNKPGLDYAAFRERLSYEDFNEAQSTLLETRLQLLESFMKTSSNLKAASMLAKVNSKGGKEANKANLRKTQQAYNQNKADLAKDTDIWSFEAGTLTIVDLSCPFIDESAACAMFDICLALFLEERAGVGRIIALDEAHKFMSESHAASIFTESLLTIIRQQRHLATRVIVATQEPTISPKLLDLSSMTIVHRFTSPSWLQALKSHLAGISDNEESSQRDVSEIFKEIVNLEAGQALLFSPSAILDTVNDQEGDGSINLRPKKLGLRYVKLRVRKRLTADGGRSILAA